jgi:hypothetical protein
MPSTVESWSAILALYASFSQEQRDNITKMMKGYGSYDPLWQRLMRSGLSHPYDIATSLFRWVSGGNLKLSSTALAIYLLLMYAVVPDNDTSLAISFSDIVYEDTISRQDQRTFSLDIPSRTLVLGVQNGGNVSFLFNQTVTHDFTAGLWLITFSSDWNSIISVSTYSGGPTWQWTFTPVDVDGNILANANITISQNNIILYSSTTAPWIQNVPENAYNISVYWLQNLLVSNTLNIYIGANTATSLSCFCYPYIIGGTRYWVASNSTINSTSTTSDSVTANFHWFSEDFDLSGWDLRGWGVSSFSSAVPEIESSNVLFMDAFANHISAIATGSDMLGALPSQYTVEFRLKIAQSIPTRHRNLRQQLLDSLQHLQ